ncbi:ferritin-like domain-containing protein [Phenylobacterium sp. LjRoot225]|uniref:ferritin-like domain-containing protein n=1 Tax=Phenylobacterium sp. LjRoot225 TaxID=3342285 RepID=UPI003ECCA7EA
MIAFLQRLVWSSTYRRAKLLLRFAEVEADGGHDLVRAAEVTRDPILRKLFLRHASDEAHHAALFRRRGLDLLRSGQAQTAMTAPPWLAPGERGLDDVRIDEQQEEKLLAFLHLSEKAAARDFASYAKVLERDPDTRAVFQMILRDESFHMRYTHQQLIRLEPRRHAQILWRARRSRLWRLYLRLAGGIGALFGAVMLSVQYFVLLPPFALLARRAARSEPEGWRAVADDRARRLTSQY